MGTTRTAHGTDLGSGRPRGSWSSGSRSSCPACGRETVTVVGLDPGDGSQVEMHSCGSCEARTWHRDGQQVERAAVLETLRRTGGPAGLRRRRTS